MKKFFKLMLVLITVFMLSIAVFASEVSLTQGVGVSSGALTKEAILSSNGNKPITQVDGYGTADFLAVEIIKITSFPSSDYTTTQFDTPLRGNKPSIYIKMTYANNYMTYPFGDADIRIYIKNAQGDEIVPGSFHTSFVGSTNYPIPNLSNNITLNYAYYKYDWNTSALLAGTYTITAETHVTNMGNNTWYPATSAPKTATLIKNPLPLYESSFWNDDYSIKNKTNCYAYAMNWPNMVTYGTKVTFPQSTTNPGDFSPDSTTTTFQNNFTFDDPEAADLIARFVPEGNSIEIKKSTLDACLRDNFNMVAFALFGALLDAKANNHEFREATEPEIAGNVSNGQWVVYLVATDRKKWSGNPDYHWYRQDFNANSTFINKWSHKPGHKDVTDKTTSIYGTDWVYLNTIVDPTPLQVNTRKIYNSDGTVEQGTHIRYDIVVGAYVVGPK